MPNVALQLVADDPAPERVHYFAPFRVTTPVIVSVLSFVGVIGVMLYFAARSLGWF